MENIIEKVDVHLIEKELNKDRFLRRTNNGNKEIYIVTAHNSPNVMKEIGRLREVTFRDAGGGTGKNMDIDKYDISNNPFKQLIVWSPEDKEIVGSYRYILGKDLQKDRNNKIISATSALFSFTAKFNEHFLPLTIELGRSFVQPNYQPTYNIRKGIYSLDNLWDGLGAITIVHPDVKYFFGKITMYPSFNREARDYILSFLQLYFADKDNLVKPIYPVNVSADIYKLQKHFSGNNYDEDFKKLVRVVKSFGEYIPPLVNAYMNLSATMRVFGTSVNSRFGNVEETGILVTIEDIYDIKKDRHVSTYRKEE